MDTASRYSVSDLTLLIKASLEEGFADVTVEGEISNFKLHTSGHCYFTLKDDRAQLSAVLWRSRAGALRFTPAAGMKVLARGTVTVYPVRGVYQLDVVSLQPAGVGELQAAFERLKRRLHEEGLFDDSRKRPIPRLPSSVGIVTSETGAAITDILNVFTRRAPYLELVLVPVRVQGPGAAEEIAGGIRTLDASGGVDVIIVGRGGGSIEDLWAFNEEVVARAIAASRIPVISAVGHEIDFTIADFVADLRAPTPSAAAELAAPSKRELIETLGNYCYTAGNLVEMLIARGRERLRSHRRSYAFNMPADILRQRSQRLDDLRTALTRTVDHLVTGAGRELGALRKRLENLDPARVLERGFVLAYRNGRPAGRAEGIGDGERLSLRFSDGWIGTLVTDRGRPAEPATTPNSDGSKGRR